MRWGDSDTAVIDEPCYAAYLSQTGLVHPMRTEVIASAERLRDVVSGLRSAVDCAALTSLVHHGDELISA